MEGIWHRAAAITNESALSLAKQEVEAEEIRVSPMPKGDLDVQKKTRV